MKRLAFLLLFSLFSFSAVSQTFSNFEGPTPAVVRQQIKRLLDSSNVYYFKGNYVKSLKFNVEILNKALEINDPKYIHQGYRLLGYDYLVLKDSILAQESFEKSEKYAKLSKNDTTIAQTKMDLANLYATVYQNHKKALDYHDESIRLFDKIKDSTGLSKAHYNASLTALDADNFEKALFHLESCKDYSDFYNGSFEMGMNNQFGTIYRELKDYEKADSLFKATIVSAIKHDFPIELATSYQEYSQSLFEQEKYEEAFDMRKKYEEKLVDNMDILQNTESKSVSAKFQVQEHKKSVEEAELHAAFQAEAARNKNTQNNILMVVASLGLFLFLGLLYAFRKRKQLVQLLKERNLEYLHAKEKSERLALAKSQFFSTVSHELRTPLYGVIGLSTILLEDQQLKSHEKDLKSLKFSADYLLALINDVLQINKIESNNLEDEETTFNLRELISSISSSFEYMRLQNKNTFHITISDQIPTRIKGNSVRLSQVLMNLVGNACKFTENGAIHINADVIALSSSKIKVQFSIEDTGIGIAEEKHHTIFDEFSQVENLNYSYQGTGLGLPIVKKLLKLSNSEIKLKSELGKGSSFSFELFFKLPTKEKVAVESVPLDVNLLKGTRVLIAEDNRINQIVTKKILEKNGVICTLAENGNEAIVEVQKQTFDLILMDLNMPIKNGFEASKTIRKSNKKIPIIALTAVEVEEVRNEIYEVGMNDIIVKPYDVNKFIQTILKNMMEGVKPIPLGKKKAI